MNITLLGHNDIASLHALDRVAAGLPEHTFTLLLSSDNPSNTHPHSPLVDLAEADARLCESLLAGKIAGRASLSVSPKASNTFNSPNSDDGLQQLTNTQPDLIVSVRYRKILKERAIAIPRLGILNLHSGVLPDYRGVMATFWAMLAGEQTIGSTLHRIVDSGIDTGPIINIQKRAMRPDRSYLANVLGLYESGSIAIANAVRALASGETLVEHQPKPGGDYYSFPTNDDVIRFQKSGLALIDGSEHRELQ